MSSSAPGGTICPPFIFFMLKFYPWNINLSAKRPTTLFFNVLMITLIPDMFSFSKISPAITKPTNCSWATSHFMYVTLSFFSLISCGVHTEIITFSYDIVVVVYLSFRPVRSDFAKCLVSMATLLTVVLQVDNHSYRQ